MLCHPRHNQCFVTPFARTDTYLNSFLLSAINLWNSLPDSLVELDRDKDRDTLIEQSQY